MIDKDYYAIGVRDAYAFVFATIRSEGIGEGLNTIAKILYKIDPKQIHVKWYLEKHCG